RRRLASHLDRVSVGFNLQDDPESIRRSVVSGLFEWVRRDFLGVRGKLRRLLRVQRSLVSLARNDAAAIAIDRDGGVYLQPRCCNEAARAGEDESHTEGSVPASGYRLQASGCVLILKLVARGQKSTLRIIRAPIPPMQPKGLVQTVRQCLSIARR